MIDNFNLIGSLLNKKQDANDTFYHLQIVRRQKDHKNNGVKVKESAISTYFIKNKEHLDELKDEIVLLCEHYGARAYINVSPKSFDKVQKEMLLKIASLVAEGNVQNPQKTLNSVVGKVYSKQPIWIIDIDNKEDKERVRKWLNNYFDEPYMKAEVPTHSCVHFLVKPFNLNLFANSFPDIDVHKNSMGTLLYYPNSIEHKD